ncbi:hypothetical protein C8T65DRAFT_746003 [Cerioporus squamosus]|nr:hypothetical protein C8T65DRAFT_746003 [Cerioporus squamosus]
MSGMSPASYLDTSTPGVTPRDPQPTPSTSLADMSSFISSLLGSRNKHLPPGPPGLPIIGNLKDIPSTEQWRYFYEQSQKYTITCSFLHIAS